MRRPTIVATILIIATVAILGATVIKANSPRLATATPAASASIGVMQMMKDAKNLPTEQFDAH